MATELEREALLAFQDYLSDMQTIPHGLFIDMIDGKFVLQDSRTLLPIAEAPIFNTFAEAIAFANA